MSRGHAAIQITDVNPEGHEAHEVLSVFVVFVPFVVGTLDKDDRVTRGYWLPTAGY